MTGVTSRRGSLVYEAHIRSGKILCLTLGISLLAVCNAGAPGQTAEEISLGRHFAVGIAMDSVDRQRRQALRKARHGSRARAAARLGTIGAGDHRQQHSRRAMHLDDGDERRPERRRPGHGGAHGGRRAKQTARPAGDQESPRTCAASASRFRVSVPWEIFSSAIS